MSAPGRKLPRRLPWAVLGVRFAGDGCWHERLLLYPTRYDKESWLGETPAGKVVEEVESDDEDNDLRGRRDRRGRKSDRKDDDDEKDHDDDDKDDEGHDDADDDDGD